MHKILTCILALSLMIAAVGCTNPGNEGDPVEGDVPPKGIEDSLESPDDGKDDGGEEKTVTWNAPLYFSDEQGINIVKQEREMETVPDTETGELSTEEKARICIEELIKGSGQKDLKHSIPESTKVLSTALEENTLILDLSKEFVDDNVGGSTGTQMAIAPIVLTLTSLEGVEEVSFKIEGEVVEDFKGHIQLDEPFKRSEYEQHLK
ncbi:MAG: GerMN domain-containing protein [Firmicutes bacterium]|nr:GerMN domain-containing protein [Bacillota bacterium]